MNTISDGTENEAKVSCDEKWFGEILQMLDFWNGQRPKGQISCQTPKELELSQLNKKGTYRWVKTITDETQIADWKCAPGEIEKLASKFEGSVEFNLENLLGVGGQAIVISHLESDSLQPKAFKIMPMNETDVKTKEIAANAMQKFEEYKNASNSSVRRQRRKRTAELCLRQTFSNCALITLLIYAVGLTISVLGLGISNIIIYKEFGAEAWLEQDHAGTFFATMIGSWFIVSIYLYKECRKKSLNTWIRYFRKSKITPETALQSDIERAELADFEALLDGANMSLVTDNLEYECAEIKHENVIQYENVTVDKIGDILAHISGTYLIVYENEISAYKW